MIHLVLLSGGSGTRLWPLSNSSRSKQFLKVLRDEAGNHVSMVQRVFGQIRKVPADVDITIATCASQEYSISRQVEGAYTLVLEPERRDTAPAIMLACANLALEQKADADDTVIVMPIDTYAEQAYYDGVVKLDEAVQSGFAELVLLGVEPTYPSEKYGYIVPETPEGDLRRVARFTEKPNENAAKQLIAQGALWNCGVFAFKLGYLTELAAKYLPVNDFSQFRDRYSNLPKNSFDYEVVEKAGSIGVVPYSGEWMDLGTWNTLTDEMADASAGRVVIDESTCENVHVINETGFPMVVAGMKDAVVVATPDGILVSSKEASTGIKAQISQAAESRPMYEQCRWGEYRVIDSSVFPDGAKALTKELIVRDGKQLSYQRHAHRGEVWTVVSGAGEVVLDGLVQQVRAGSVVNIGKCQMHAGRAIGSDLHIIEVQQGEILAEEDVERFGEFWK
ncbi:sugar phosphate nucleotidyltransferase [Paratractidigestivibacter sp.]|uniref:sugar phosphate nucleotidyltransferase n=1 Tax=Paratractidigestivibacter sp. TaxID=2847316 RepID=UPI002AC9246C|nr:sugar phosphate nucleotidyltransferase [Paratractidigestivibacter sp.]